MANELTPQQIALREMTAGIGGNRPAETRINRLRMPDFGPDQGRTAPALRVVAPLNVRAAPSGAELLANSLGVALDAATPVLLNKVKEHAESETLAGMLAATGGTVDEAQVASSKSYAHGVVVAELRAEVARFIIDFEQVTLEAGVGRMSVEQFAGLAQDQMKARFGDLERDESIRIVAPELLAWHAQRVAKFGAERLEMQSKQTIDDVGVILSTKAQANELTDDEIAWAHDALYRVLGGTASNEQIAKMVGELAVAQGDPSIIDRLPESMQHSVTGQEIPGVASIPRLARVLEQYRREAESVFESRKGEASKARSRAVEQAMFGSAARGHDITDSVVAAVESGDLSPDAGRVMLNFSETQRTERTRGYADPSAVADLERRVVAGEFDADPSAVLELRSEIGAGHTGNNEAMRLYGLAVRTRDAEERLSATDKLYKDVVRKSLEPARNLATGQPEPAGVLRQSRALIEFQERLERGESSEQAASEILKKHNLTLNEAGASEPQSKADAHGFIPGTFYRRGGEYYRYLGNNRFQRVDAVEASRPVIDSN